MDKIRHSNIYFCLHKIVGFSEKMDFVMVIWIFWIFCLVTFFAQLSFGNLRVIPTQITKFFSIADFAFFINFVHWLICCKFPILQSFNADLNDKRNAVKDIINKCNKMLRETTNAQTDEIKSRLEDIKSQVRITNRVKEKLITLLLFLQKFLQ